MRGSRASDAPGDSPKLVGVGPDDLDREGPLCSSNPVGDHGPVDRGPDNRTGLRQLSLHDRDGADRGARGAVVGVPANAERSRREAATDSGLPTVTVLAWAPAQAVMRAATVNTARIAARRRTLRLDAATIPGQLICASWPSASASLSG